MKEEAAVATMNSALKFNRPLKIAGMCDAIAQRSTGSADKEKCNTHAIIKEASMAIAVD